MQNFEHNRYTYYSDACLARFPGHFILPRYDGRSVANLLYWYPAGRGKGRYGELLEWGLKPEDFLPT